MAALPIVDAIEGRSMEHQRSLERWLSVRLTHSDNIPRDMVAKGKITRNGHKDIDEAGGTNARRDNGRGL